MALSENQKNYAQHVGQKTKWFITNTHGPEHGDKLNNRLDDLFSSGFFTFVRGGREEAPTTGLVHDHALLIGPRHACSVVMRRLMIDNKLPNIISATTPRPDGTVKHRDMTKVDVQNRLAYLEKTDIKVDWGEEPTNKAGQRTDIEQFRDAVVNGTITSPKQVMMTMPGVARSLGTQLPTWLAMLKPTKAYTMPNQLRKFQHELIEKLRMEPDDRTISFYIDEIGGKGKSELCRMLLLGDVLEGKKIQVLQPGKRSDLAYQIEEDTDVFLIDLARFRGNGESNILQYDILENIKDGMIQSDKYMSRMKIMNNKAHVVVFTNHEPDLSALSADRYDRNYLTEEDAQPYDDPQVPDFGSEFSSDITGDGPVTYKGNKPAMHKALGNQTKRNSRSGATYIKKRATSENEFENYCCVGKHSELTTITLETPSPPMKKWPKDYPSYKEYLHTEYPHVALMMHKLHWSIVMKEMLTGETSYMK